MNESDTIHPKESHQDRCRQILDNEWKAETVGLAFSQFVANFAVVVSNGEDINEAIPTWNRDESQPESNVLGGSFSKRGIKVVVRYQRVDGITGSNEFSLLAEYGSGQLRSELLFMSEATKGKVFYAANLMSDVFLNGEVLKYPPMALAPNMIRAGSVNAWNLYCAEDQDFPEEDEEERSDRIFDGLVIAFEDPPAYNEVSVRKLARTIETMRRDDFGGNLPNSEIETVMVKNLEDSKERLEHFTSCDKAILADLKDDVDYWSRMQELMRRIRQAEVVLRQR